MFSVELPKPSVKIIIHILINEIFLLILFSNILLLLYGNRIKFLWSFCLFLIAKHLIMSGVVIECKVWNEKSHSVFFFKHQPSLFSIIQCTSWGRSSQDNFYLPCGEVGINSIWQEIILRLMILPSLTVVKWGEIVQKSSSLYP